jgi:hypothetical protein
MLVVFYVVLIARSRARSGSFCAWFDHAAHEVQGGSLYPDERGGGASYAVLHKISAAVLLPHDGCDRRGISSGRYGDGYAR